jgi:hypothetical protein
VSSSAPLGVRVARGRPKAYPSVELVNASFEAAQLTMAILGLAHVASAWHWIAPKARFQNSHGPSRPRAIWPAFIGIGMIMFRTSRAIGSPRPSSHSISATRKTRLAQVSSDTFAQTVTYSAPDYGNRLRTYAATLAMAPATRTALLEARRLIDVQCAGQVYQHYAMRLQMAQRK